MSTCYGRIIYVLCVKIICGQKRLKRKIEREIRVGHLRVERKEDLRWRRGDVVTVAGDLLRIGEWVIVRRLVWRVSGAGKAGE